MIIINKNHSLKSSSIEINGLSLFINENNFNIKENWIVERPFDLYGSAYFDLTYLSKKINNIKKRLKLKSIKIIIDENTNGMFIEMYHNEYGEFYESIIYINFDLLTQIDEDDCVVYICHELGHLLDSNNLYDNKVFMLKWDYYTRPISIIATAVLSIILLKDMEPILQSLYLILICCAIFGPLSLFKNFLNSYLSKRSEFRADNLCVQIVGDLNKVIKSLKTLDNLEEVEDSSDKFFSTHPTLKQRIISLKIRFWYKLIF